MECTVYFHVTAFEPGRPVGCGIRVVDDDSARPIHESGICLPDTLDRHTAALDALTRVLDIILPLGSTRVALCCDNELLTRQVTGQTRVTMASLEARFHDTMMRLLQLDEWQITTIDGPEMSYVTDLATRAAREGQPVEALSFEQADQQRETRTGVPQWTVMLLEDPGRACPAGCGGQVRYPFGPDTPAGFCVHATRVVLEDGPLTWADPDQCRMTTVCPCCDVPISIERVRGTEEPTPPTTPC